MNVEPSDNDDVWAFFVRNWSSLESGLCDGQDLLYLPNNSYTVRLPWKSGATSVDIRSQTWHRNRIQAPDPTIERVRGDGVYVTFTLDAPRVTGSMWDGELHLTWHQ